MRLSCHAYCQCDRCIYSPVNLEQTATIMLFLVRPYHSAISFIHSFIYSFNNELFIFAEHPRESKLHNWPLPVNMENLVKVFATLH